MGFLQIPHLIDTRANTLSFSVWSRPLCARMPSRSAQQSVVVGKTWVRGRPLAKAVAEGSICRSTMMLPGDADIDYAIEFDLDTRHMESRTILMRRDLPAQASVKTILRVSLPILLTHTCSQTNGTNAHDRNSGSPAHIFHNSDRQAGGIWV